MKPNAWMGSVAIGTLLFSVNAVYAEQMGDRQDWKVRNLHRLLGETCEEDKDLQPPDNPKCATLTAGGGFTTVSDFAVPFASLHRNARK